LDTAPNPHNETRTVILPALSSMPVIWYPSKPNTASVLVNRSFEIESTGGGITRRWGVSRLGAGTPRIRIFRL
jgi:hypothetical protein